jgi:hypothetical protein
VARVWAAAAAAGVGLVARGRLLPTVGADETDVWRAGPLDPADLSWLRELAAVFPPTAHALAIPGSRPMRLRSPEALIRDLWDAIADMIARSSAAPRTTASPAFAAAEPTRVSDLTEWLADTTDGLSAGARLGLRIEAVPASPMTDDEEDDLVADEADEAERAEASAPAFQLVLQLRSNADMAAAGGGAAAGQPVGIDLDDDALTSLLGPAAEELAGVGVEVLWPSSLLGDGLKLRAVPTPAPEKLTEAGFGPRRAAGFPLAAHARRRAARRRRDRRPGRGETAADPAARPHRSRLSRR